MRPLQLGRDDSGMFLECRRAFEIGAVGHASVCLAHQDLTRMNGAPTRMTPCAGRSAVGEVMGQLCCGTALLFDQGDLRDRPPRHRKVEDQGVQRGPARGS